MNKKIIIIIGALVAVLLIVVGVVVFVVVGSEPKEEVIVYSEFPLSESYANLQGGSIVKYQITIQYTGEETSAILTANKTAIDNNINEIMRMKSLADLEQSNSMERLRTEVQDMIIDLLEVDETVITNIYFVQYVTQ